ncbi:MAG: acyl carrier protein [Lysobacterales bacterium CG17_big_fil_post_rev_8_21_14_2_50_64_11]|nr:MAG: acyl carrier protein [Xanthomonadales bacterium CG17_big_fil_post_rev_8_21_14_2_50_64_11]PIX59388.1 MAG: acyl carrier protein [Xanthomonadales bacterium CG_4_10_14_3_um_filter_64_11]
MTQEQVYRRIVDILQETFGIDPARITPQARLGEDLDIDSIDAIDLIVQLKPLMASGLDPDAFKSVRTVADVVDAIYSMMGATAEVRSGT